MGFLWPCSGIRNMYPCTLSYSHGVWGNRRSFYFYFTTCSVLNTTIVESIYIYEPRHNHTHHFVDPHTAAYAQIVLGIRDSVKRGEGKRRATQRILLASNVAA